MERPHACVRAQASACKMLRRLSKQLSSETIFAG